ncbi:MAG: HAMP domain-containing sensor histidine kinase [Acidimicrobiia bacterium]
MTFAGLSSRARTLVLVVLTLVFAGCLATWAQDSLGEVLGIPLMFVGYGVASWLYVRGSRAFDGRERLAWTLIGGAFLLGAIGVATVAVAFGLGFDIPAFGPLDLIFISAYVANLAGMWVLPHLQGGPIRRARIFIDGLVGAVSLAVVGWVWFLRDILEQVGQASPFQVAVGSAYPLIDLATLIVVVMVTLRRSTLRFDPRVLLIGAGFVAQAVADLLYLHRGLGESFSGAHPVYPLFLLGIVFYLMAGLILDSHPREREYAERSTPWWAMVAPYGAAVVLVSTSVVRVIGENHEAGTVELFVGAVIVVSLVILRQALAIRETRELVEQQRSALVSSISHELRTPLTAMVGFLEILVDPDQHIETRARNEMLEIVTYQASYMARIVSDLVMLNRSKPDITLHQDLVDVDSVVKSAIAALDIDTGPGVSMNIEPGLAGFFDRDRIQQILVNLLTNAARYGGPRRLVTAYRDGNDLHIEVHDDGEGVKKRYELLIWERFERGAHRYDAGTPGSGVGLAIVDMLARAHNGVARYRRSEILGGACFSVDLPGRAEATQDQPVPEAERVVSRRDS